MGGHFPWHAVADVLMRLSSPEGSAALHSCKDLAVSPRAFPHGLIRQAPDARRLTTTARLCSHLVPCGRRALPATRLPLARGVSGLSSTPHDAARRPPRIPRKRCGTICFQDSARTLTSQAMCSVRQSPRHARADRAVTATRHWSRTAALRSRHLPRPTDTPYAHLHRAEMPRAPRR